MSEDTATATTATAAPTTGFPALDFNDENEPVVIESLCFQCYQNGITRLLPTLIPYFREVIVASFECESCGYRNNELQTASEIQEKGIHAKVSITTMQDLNRQVIKSASATITIPELDFEFPPGKTDLSTIEGYLTTAASNLEAQQSQRRDDDPEMADKVERVITGLRERANLSEPFTFIVDDPSGNSFIQPLMMNDPALKETHYTRTQQQDIDLGLAGAGLDDVSAITEKSKVGAVAVSAPTSTLEQFVSSTEKEVYTIPTDCVDCNTPGENRMFICDVPHFKEIVIMSFNCENCGFRSNEVKPTGGISDKARRTTLRVSNRSDLDRLVLKSDSSSLQIPELELEVVTGSLGSCFTTLEGLLERLADELRRSNPFSLGDSTHRDDNSISTATAFARIIARLDNYHQGLDLPFTLILDDALGNTYIEHKPDSESFLSNEDYERTWEQNEEFGINDMKTENYEAPSPTHHEVEEEENESGNVGVPDLTVEDTGKGAPAA